MSDFLSPDVVVDSLAATGGRIHVVRDDRLPGGTKQRAILPFLQDCLSAGITEFIYASPFSGFAQVALAASAATLGRRAVLFCEAAPATGEAHAFTRLAAAHGAEIHLCDTLCEAETRARQFVHRKPAARKIPLGFACDEFRARLTQALLVQWPVVLAQTATSPRRLWLPVGSGTLATVFREVVPDELEICCVDVHVLTSDDDRIRHVQRLPNTRYFSAPEEFAEPVRLSAPIPSNHYYDAKLWQFLQQHARTGDVWWNVAR